MPPSLQDRLTEARRRHFVGRQNERELFLAAVTAPEFPFNLLYLFGPGGVGKTSLLREFSHLADQSGLAIVSLDGRHLDPTPANFLTALQTALSLATAAEIFPTLASHGRYLLLLDTAELLHPLEEWLRDTFLPQLPANVLVVMASRQPPEVRWRTDPGWQQLMRVGRLPNLSEAESRALLVRRQIPAREHEAVLAFTHGHPLAISLVADLFAQQPDTHFRPEEAPDIIKTVLEQFLQEAPSLLHRAALEVCCQMRLLTEPLLAAVLELDDPQPLFAWLRTLSFIEADRRGLFPHDLAREALAADLRWRNPSWQAEIHQRAQRYYIGHFRRGSAHEQRRILADYIFLHRDNPIIRPYFEWQSTGTTFTDGWRLEDTAALRDMVAQHEGETAAHIFSYWLAQQPHHAAVLRQADGAPQGVLLALALEQTTAEERAHDPGATAVWDYLAQHAPLQGDERATLFRFWLARDGYQAVSPAQSRLFLNMVQHYLTTPRLAFSFVPCADPDFWALGFAFADLQRLAGADFVVDGRSFGVYGHDWRVTPPLEWLALLAKRQLGQAIDILPAPIPPLSEEEFATAVREALRHYTDVVALGQNRLWHGRLLAGVPPEQRVAALQKLLLETAALLQANPRQLKAYRALTHTYFQPAATQEQAAEQLDMPFSTYRRHLNHGLSYLVAYLWRQEVEINRL